ncbi:MAG TPA: hypothetical protein VFU73_12770 [Actinocrinis sp.]|nr:hypothetical protein [Actinocrinis sp.]
MLGTLAVLGLALPADAAAVHTGATVHSAMPVRTATPTVVTHAVSGDNVSRAQALQAYWTPQRMASAIPMEAPQDAAASASALRTTPAPEVSAAGPAKILARPTGPTGATGLAVQGVRPNALATPAAQGRVFFTDPVTGTNYSCSGGTINNPAGDMVITAGHCVYENGRWMTNWVYIPAYFNGPTGYGTWFAKYMNAFTQWTANSDFNYDFAIVNVAPASNGKTLVATAGGNGLEYNQPDIRTVVIWGYPAATNNGQTPVYCIDTTFQSGLRIGAPCALSGGASGGPWLDGYDVTTATGYEDGLNSTGTIPPANTFSPYFGSNVNSLYADTATF